MAPLPDSSRVARSSWYSVQTIVASWALRHTSCQSVIIVTVGQACKGLFVDLLCLPEVLVSQGIQEDLADPAM